MLNQSIADLSCIDRQRNVRSIWLSKDSPNLIGRFAYFKCLLTVLKNSERVGSPTVWSE